MRHEVLVFIASSSAFIAQNSFASRLKPSAGPVSDAIIGSDALNWTRSEGPNL